MSNKYSSLDKEDVERLKKGIIDCLEGTIKTVVDTDTPYRAVIILRNDWVDEIKERIGKEFAKYDEDLVYSIEVFSIFSQEYASYEFVISPREKYCQTYTSSSIEKEKERLAKELEKGGYKNDEEK